MKEAAREITTSIACLKKASNVLVICGSHNREFAERLVMESFAVGAYPYLWVFDERLFLEGSRRFSGGMVSALPRHVHSLVENSDVIMWLSQFDNVERFPANVRKTMIQFWDNIEEAIRDKPRLFVTLLSAECVESMGISYEKFLSSFAKAVNVDFSRLLEVGDAIAAKLNGKGLVQVYDANGTDLTFSIQGRRVGVEAGTLEECFSTGRACEVEVPAGEVYVAPIETSANGLLVVDEFRDYGIRKLKLYFKDGRLTKFKAERGSSIFAKLLKEAEGDKDRIAEFGIGTNHGMKPFGYRIFDEKALGTVHIAIGNNIHLGGVNKASIHYDFVLCNPSIEADDAQIMKNGKLV